MIIIPILIIMMQPIFATAQPYRNVSLGTSIVADGANTSWSSPSGEFAFGFQQVSPGGYLLAIWFDKITEKTIVWSANRADLAPRGSTIQLLSDGRLELNNPGGRQIWGANPNRSGVAYGAMLDSGNFVLATNASSVSWQSFEHPSDTLLPSQVLSQGVNLVSSFSAANYSKGRFVFTLATDGNLVLYTRNFPMDVGIDTYWSSGTVGSGSQLVFNQSGYIYLVARNETILSTLSSNGVSRSQFYQRFSLEYDGVLRHYVHPKSGNTTSGRAMAWSVNSFLPGNICRQIEQERGGGACGFNSVCTIDGTDQRRRCSCPVGYSPIDPQDWKSGCKQDFIQQNCGQENQENDSFSFVEMINTDFPLSDHAAFRQVNEEWCRQTCLADCFCSVAIYRDNNCWMKNVPLSNGRTDPRTGGKALIKIRKNTTVDHGPSGWNSRKSSRSSTLIIIGSVLLGSSVLVNLLLLAFVFLLGFRFNRKKSKSLQAISTTFHPGLNIRSFSFDELQAATNEFKEELGSGACSTVYKGLLNDENGRLIAVKKLLKVRGGVEQEFIAEVSSISRTNHKNLVQLLGYCDEGQNKLLVYEFMSNGSLASFLFESSTRPNWYRRVQIAFAIARGLCYLHEECSTQIIHCDIKPQNILLDDSHTPKISDFGLAKLLRPDQTRTTTGIRGTKGYVAPEWFRNMPITAKVDVYSFGILLLELLCCRKTYEANIEDEREAILADWAYDCYKDGMLHLLVANDREARDHMNRFEKFVKIAIWCTQEDPALRPQMKRVIQMLEGSVEVPSPPDPASFIG